MFWPYKTLYILLNHIRVIKCEIVYCQLSLIVEAGCFTVRTLKSFLKIEAGSCCAWICACLRFVISCLFFSQQAFFLFNLLFLGWEWIGVVGQALITLTLFRNKNSKIEVFVTIFSILGLSYLAFALNLLRLYIKPVHRTEA